MTAAHAPRRPKWRRRAGDRPDEVLDAALDLFLEKGFAATRVEDIARRAGLSKGAVYLYFDSKEDVLKALVRRAMVPVAEAAATVAQTGGGDPRTVLATMVRLVAARFGDHRLSAIPRLVLAESTTFPEIAAIYRREVIDRVMGALEGLIRRGIDEGVFRPVDPRLTVRNVAGPLFVHMLLASVFASEPGSDMAFDQFADNHLDVLMNGLARRPGET